MLKKRYTCWRCGHRTSKNTTEEHVNAKEQISCTECGSLMDLVSVQELGLPRAVEVEG